MSPKRRLRKVFRRGPDEGRDESAPIVEHTDEHGALRCLLAANAHGRYCVPPSSMHRPAAKKTLAGDVYEPDTIAFLTSHCGSGDVIHAGTYFGDFLPALSRAIAPGALVWAFEPSLENFRCARVTLSMNDCENVRLLHAGLGERRSMGRVVTVDEAGQPYGGGSRIVPEGSQHGAEPVEMVTIDEAVPSERAVSIIQLDVEGYEQPALAGAIGTIRRHRPIIVVESIPDHEWLSGNILSLGYERTHKVHTNTVFVAR